jgi:hypothetical protein
MFINLPMLNKKIFIVITILLCFACQKDKLPEDDNSTDPCSKVVNGVYQYPSEPPGNNLTNAEEIEYWNIPEAVLPCLLTDGLLESCLSFHSLGSHIFIDGNDGVQSSYDYVKSICRGFPELEKWPDALSTLIARYKSIDTIHFDTLPSLNNLHDYGGYDFFTYVLEVILGQEAFLKKATMRQKHELLSEIFVKQAFREHRDTWYFFEGPVFVMARMMYIDNYQPFMDEYVNNSEIRHTVTSGSPTYPDMKLLIISLAENYLTTIDPDQNLIFGIGNDFEYSDPDFALYDSSTHILYFRDFHPEFDSYNNKATPFAFYIGNDTIMKGNFWPMFLSTYPSGPYIGTAPFLYQYYALRFSIHRTFSNQNDPDPRNEIGLIDDFKNHNLLHSGLTVSIDSVEINNTGLIFSFSVTNYDSDNLLILDIDKMGPRLFHYFTNGLLITNQANSTVFTSNIGSDTPSPWNGWEAEWLSQLSSGESKQFKINYTLSSTLSSGDYNASFTYPGLEFQVEHDQLYQASGRIWLGDIKVMKMITIQ